MAKSIRESYGETLVELGKENKKIVVFDADLSGATKTSTFKKEFPDRFFDMGIAEANMMCTAAAFAREGLIPFASTFAIFGAGRAYEQIRNSIAYENLNVKIALTHAGLSVGEDGASHQSIEDIALMRVLPNMKVFVPCDMIETRKIIKKVAEIDGPCYIRLARPNSENVTKEDTPFQIGKANILREGKDVCIFATGLMVDIALKAQEELKKDGIDAYVVNFNTIKPLDKDIILEMNKKCKVIISIEEHSIIGGLGSAIAEVLAGNSGAKFKSIGIEDKFGKSGDVNSLFKEYGLTKEHIVEVVKKNL